MKKAIFKNVQSADFLKMIVKKTESWHLYAHLVTKKSLDILALSL